MGFEPASGFAAKGGFVGRVVEVHLARLEHVLVMAPTGRVAVRATRDRLNPPAERLTDFRDRHQERTWND
jgi:hypothetical protein